MKNFAVTCVDSYGNSPSLEFRVGVYMSVITTGASCKFLELSFVWVDSDM